MTPNYRMMCYFVCATLHMYRAEIQARAGVCAIMEANPRAKTEWFVETHRDLMARIAQEARNLFTYELSHRQLCLGVFAYFAKAQTVAGSHAASLEQEQEHAAELSKRG